MAQQGPLSEQDFEEIKRQLEQLKIAEGEIKRAEAAGIDVVQSKRDLLDAKGKLTKLKQVYFPNRA